MTPLSLKQCNLVRQERHVRTVTVKNLSGIAISAIIGALAVPFKRFFSCKTHPCRIVDLTRRVLVGIRSRRPGRMPRFSRTRRIRWANKRAAILRGALATAREHPVVRARPGLASLSPPF